MEIVEPIVMSCKQFIKLGFGCQVSGIDRFQVSGVRSLPRIAVAAAQVGSKIRKN